MATRESVPNNGDVAAFIDSVEDAQQREESIKLMEIMGRISGAPPVMYGKSVVGFGSSKIIYADGHEEPWFSVGFSPRKGKFSLYILNDASEHEELLSKLGSYKTGKSCLWVKRLEDVDRGVLEEIISGAVERDRARGYM